MSLSIGGRAAGAGPELATRVGTARHDVPVSNQETAVRGRENGLSDITRGSGTLEHESSTARHSCAKSSDNDEKTPSLTQLLQSLRELLQQLKNKIGGAGGEDSKPGNQYGQGDNTQGTSSGEGGLLAQLQALLQKLLGGQSANEGNSDAGRQSQTPDNSAGNTDTGNSAGGGLVNLLNELIAMLKKLTGQSEDQASATPASGTQSGAQSPGEQQSEGSGLLSKLSALLSSLQASLGKL